MAKPIIVLIDPEDGTVSVYGRFNATVSLQDIFLLRAYIGGQDIIYVDGWTEANGDDVLGLAESLSQQAETETEPQYLRYVGEGYRRVDDIKITFAGPKDVKMLDKLGYDIFERSPQLRKMLHNKEIEVLSESQIKALRKKAVDPRARDKQLDSMILNKKEDAFEIENMFKEENEINDSTEVLTEAELIMRELKRQ